MGFRDRVMAAVNAFKTKVPESRSYANPFFYNVPVGGIPTANMNVNPLRLRTFSESPIPRRAIDYIKNQVTRLDWDINAKDGKKLTAQQKKQIEVAKNVFHSPNGDDNWMSWLGQLVEDMLVLGWGVSEIKEWKGNDQNPYLLYPIDGASIQTYMTWDGSPNSPRYAQVDVHGHKVDFKPREIMVMKHNPRSSTPFGLSPLEVSIQHIQYLIDAQSYAGRTASNATPKKLLFMGKDMSNTQLREFRQYFRDEIEGRGHLPIVGGTDDVKSIELGNASDQALFLQWQTLLISTIANAFGLDIMKFNAIVGINRSTGDSLDDTSDEGAIRPMATQVEHYLNQFLDLFGIGDVAEFKFQYTTSFSDRKSLAVIHQIQLQDDMLTINEARKEVGLPPLPYDKSLGYSKGDLTLSEYRAIYGQMKLNDAFGVDEDMKHEGMVDVMDKSGQAALEKANTGKQSETKQVQNQNGNGGNNGVHGAPNPKPKAVNQRTDKGTNVSL